MIPARTATHRVDVHATTLHPPRSWRMLLVLVLVLVLVLLILVFHPAEVAVP
jgi:type II secretory pathway component PulM